VEDENESRSMAFFFFLLFILSIWRFNAFISCIFFPLNLLPNNYDYDYIINYNHVTLKLN
jgi:hypothetical protein